jgi:phosphoribosylformylglycinamidine (FGAM) synthase PurS component
MKIRILISLKKGVLDTQGKAIENSLSKNLGFEQIFQITLLNLTLGQLITLILSFFKKVEMPRQLFHKDF